MPLDAALEALLSEAGSRLDPQWCRIINSLEPKLRAYLPTAQAEAYDVAFLLLRG